MSYLELKGLKNLNEFEGLLKEASNNPPSGKIFVSLSIEKLVSGKYQPRNDFREDSLKELADSIRSNGIVQPIIVRELDAENYEIVAGERRWKAAILAGLEKVPVIIHNISDETALAIALIENLQREDLNPIEQAMALRRLSEEFSMTHEDIAKLVGRSRSTVTNLIRLLALNSEIKEYLREGRLEVGHAKILLRLDEVKQLEAAQWIINKKLTVREIEKLVQNILNPQVKEKSDFSEELKSKISVWEASLAREFSSKVNFQFGEEGRGRLVIHFESIDEADGLVSKLLPKELK